MNCHSCTVVLDAVECQLPVLGRMWASSFQVDTVCPGASFPHFHHLLDLLALWFCITVFAYSFFPPPPQGTSSNMCACSEIIRNSLSLWPASVGLKSHKSCWLCKSQVEFLKKRKLRNLKVFWRIFRWNILNRDEHCLSRLKNLEITMVWGLPKGYSTKIDIRYICGIKISWGEVIRK